MSHHELVGTIELNSVDYSRQALYSGGGGSKGLNEKHFLALDEDVPYQYYLRKA